jgi:hypothetical protein
MSSQGTGGTGSSTNPLSKMEYNTNAADVKAFEDMYNANESLFTMSNRPDTDKDTSRDCTTSSPVDFLYLSTIRGGRKMNGGCGCGMKGGMSDGSEGEYSGGCFTCKKGAKKITHIYSSIHIIIPKLYSKYSNKKTKKVAKPAKPTKAIIKKTKY